MISEPTVFVLGAGASMPYGFPSGRQLKDDICDRLRDASRQEGRLLGQLDFDKGLVRDFWQALSASPLPSVDMFLENRLEFVEVGKAAIATELVKYELTKALFDQWRTIRRDPYALTKTKWQDSRGNDWYAFLFEELVGGGLGLKGLEESKLSVITFNYDRSLEHYLMTGLKNSFGGNEQEYTSGLETCPIIHVHGSLGKLPWQGSGEESVPYDVWLTGQDSLVPVVKRASENIKIVHEATDKDLDFIRAREVLSSAKRIHFLGFGFHQMNCKNLHLGGIETGKFHASTGRGLSLKVLREVRALSGGNLRYDTRLRDVDIYDLLHKHVAL